MTTLFPIKYKPQENSNIKKYYEVNNTDTISDPHLEREIILTHLLQQKTDSIPSFIAEDTEFANNLMITDINCSISNPTAFCFLSTYVELPPSMNNYSYTSLVGVNNYNNSVNNLNTTIQIDQKNSPIFDTDLLIRVTNGATTFNNLGESIMWSATFADNAKQLLQIAVNSGYYGNDVSPLQITEDINFNTNFALGNSKSAFYTENEVTKQLDANNTISSNYLPSTNNITIDVIKNNFNDTSFGSFKIEQLDSSLDVKYQTNDLEYTNETSNFISNNYIIRGDNIEDTVGLSSIDVLSKYVDLTLDVSENNSVKIQISNIDPNSGLNFDDAFYNNYFTFNNEPMINNNAFMEQIIYPNSVMNVEITQEPMTITPANVSTPVYELFTLSTNGEVLDINEYDKDGEIILEVVPNADRNSISSASSNYKDINVDYSILLDNLKTNQYVDYTINNLIGNTASYAVNAVANNSEDNASVFTNSNLSDYTNIQLINSAIKNFIDPIDENIVMIKVNPYSKYSNFSQNNLLYVLNDSETVADRVAEANDVSVSVSVNISLTGNISPLLNYDDLRLNISSKKITDIFTNYIVDETDIQNTTSYIVSETNLFSNTNTLNDIWTIGYADSSQILKTSTKSGSKFQYPINESTPLELRIQFFIQNEGRIYNEKYKLSGSLDRTLSVIQDNVTKLLVTTIPSTTKYINSSIVIKDTLYNNDNTVLISYTLVIEVEITTYVNYVFTNSFGLFENICFKTPTLILKEEQLYTYYEVKSHTIKPDGTGITVTSINTVPITNENIIMTSPSKSSTKTKKLYKNITDTVPFTEANPISFSFVISKLASYPVFTNIQGRTKTSDGYSTWNPVTVQEPIDPYFTYFSATERSIVLNNPDYNINIDISFEGGGAFFIFETNYFIPLILLTNNVSSNTEITGYKYNLNDLINSFTNTDFENFAPQYFTNTNVNLLEYGTNISEKLSFRIENKNANPIQGRGTYAATMKIYYNDNNVNNLIANINIDSPNFNSPIVIYRNSNNLFNVTRTINNDVNNVLQYKLFGTNDITDSNKGTITLYDNVEKTIIDGVSVNYDSIKPTNAIAFSLNPDKISVKNSGTNSTQPAAINQLVYTQTGCESVTIPYYRGYYFENNAQNLGATYNYTINRQNLVSYKVTAVDYITNTTFTSDTQNLSANSLYTIAFDNTVGSIGTTITPSVSRFSINMLTLDNNTKLNIPLKIISDQVTITRNTLEVDYVEVILLKEYILRTFENGKTLRVLNLRANNSFVNDYYSLTYAKSSTRISYSNVYKGNPTTISIWTELFDLPFNETKNGVTFDEQGVISENGFLRISVSNTTVPGSFTYFVVAPPYLFARQMDVDGIESLTNDSDVDSSKLVTKYFPVTSQDVGSTYNPFSGNVALNNITFVKQQFKKYADYADNAVTIEPFNVTGSTVEIKEVLPESETQTESGPAQNGIIFSGYLTDLINMSIENPYKDFIKVDTTNLPILKLSYTQQNRSLSFFNPDAKPTNNIHFNISGVFVTNNNYRLNSSTSKGSKISIFDMVKGENNIVLLKYDCQPIDYTNIPREQSPNQIIFTPIKVYTSFINLPERVFGDKYPDVFTNINYANMSLNNDNDIQWTELTGLNAEDLLNNFSLKISAINSDGLKNIIECLFATSEITKNFTVVNQKNAFELLSADQTPLMIISPFGQINTSNINTKALNFFRNTKNNVEVFETSEILFNQ